MTFSKYMIKHQNHLFGMYTDENNCDMSQYISEALLCISKIKHGNYSDLISLYEN